MQKENSQPDVKGQTHVVKQEEATPITPHPSSVKTEHSALELEQPLASGCQASTQLQNISGEGTDDVKLKLNQSGEQQSSNEAPVPKPFAARTGMSASLEPD